MDTLPDLAWEALDRIATQCRVQRFLLAYSGGRDSGVLLHLAATFARTRGIKLEALHVDHGLDAQSASWAHFCQSTADALGVTLRCVRVATRPPRGASLEAWARGQRYTALATAVTQGTCVLTAHHAADQSETVLQRVLSGAGPHGLGAMREVRRFASGHLARPLLACEHGAIAAYAARHALDWIEDPANQSRRFVRNRLRHDVLPQLEAAWPGAASGLRRLAAIQSALAQHLDREADRSLACGAGPPHRLALEVLSNCDPALRPYVLRRALWRAGLDQAGQRQLDEILLRLCPARIDATPLVRWGDNEVRRYRDELWFMRSLPGVVSRPVRWDGRSELSLPTGVLRARRQTQVAAGAALDPRYLGAARLRVVFRRGGERCRPHGRGHAHSLKKLFQEWSVPPWERALIPLLEIDGDIAAVAARCVCEDYAAAAGEDGIVLEWQASIYAGAEKR